MKDIEKTEAGQKFQWVVMKAIIEDGDRILMCRRKEDVDFGMYELPGGKMEVGENIFEGLKREVREETGIEIEIEGAKKGDNVEGVNPFAILSDPLKRIALFFKARKVGGEMLSETEEQNNIRFYTKKEVGELLKKKLIRPLVKPAIEKWLKI